jgi:hypothetical protein
MTGTGAKPAFGPADDVRSIALLVIRPDGDPDVPPNGDQAADPRIYCARGGDLGAAESRDYLLREGVEVFELNVEGGAERRCADDQVEAGIALLDRSQLIDDVPLAGQEAARLHRIFNPSLFEMRRGLAQGLLAARRGVADVNRHKVEAAAELYVLGDADRCIS